MNNWKSEALMGLEELLRQIGVCLEQTNNMSKRCTESVRFESHPRHYVNKISMQLLDGYFYGNIVRIEYRHIRP